MYWIERLPGNQRPGDYFEFVRVLLALHRRLDIFFKLTRVD
jgi:hypothetical protein